MKLADLLAVLDTVPSIFQTAANIRSDLSIEDQATLDSAITRAHTEALAAVTQADSDLDAAAKT